MKHVTEGLKPERLWHHFEEISSIPRASGNESKVAEYIVRFAQQHGLRHTTDGTGNLLVVRKAGEGCESVPSVVLQSHLDMVPEKNETSNHDFEKDPIDLVVSGEWVMAKDTTLGADNGIGVAAMLAVLEDESLKTGKIECLFTVAEETGLVGALALAPGLLTGRLLINLDTEEIGAVYIGCAGGEDSFISLPVSKAPPSPGSEGLNVTLSGLAGGHSGIDIQSGRANAIQLVSRVISVLGESVEFRLAGFEGGDKLNAIPREASCTVCVGPGEGSKARRLLKEAASEIAAEYQDAETGLVFDVAEVPLEGNVFDTASTEKAVNLLAVLPHGVIAMSARIEGLVETSTNLASVREEGGTLRIGLSHRSSKQSALDWMIGVHRAVATLSGASIERTGGYPGWDPDPSSMLLAKVKKAVERVTEEKADVKAIHAGLECGIIGEKYPEMDMVSIGPTVTGVHSPSERVNIASVLVFWEILMACFEEIGND